MKLKSLLLTALCAMVAVGSSWALTLRPSITNAHELTYTYDEASNSYTFTVWGTDPYVFFNALGVSLNSASNSITFQYKTNKDLGGLQIFWMNNGTLVPAQCETLPTAFTVADDFTDYTVDLTTAKTNYSWGQSESDSFRLDFGSPGNESSDPLIVTIKDIKIDGTDDPVIVEQHGPFPTTVLSVALTSQASLDAEGNFNVTHTPADDGWTVTGQGDDPQVNGDVHWVIPAEGGDVVLDNKTLNISTSGAMPDRFEIATSVVLDDDPSVTITTPKFEFIGDDGTLTLSGVPLADQSSVSVLTYEKENISGKMPSVVKEIKATFPNLESAATVYLGQLDGVETTFTLPAQAGVQKTLEAENYDYGYGEGYFTFGQGSGYRNDGSSDGYHPVFNANADWQSSGYYINDCGYNWNGLWNDFKGLSYKNPDDTTDLTVTPAEACKRFGSWYKYTIKAPDNMKVGIDFRLGVHYGSWGVITIGNVRAFARETRWQGGARVEGMDNTPSGGTNWVNRYTGAMALQIDGKKVQSTRDARPVNTKTAAADFTSTVNDYSLWTSTKLPDGSLNDTVWHYPLPSNIQTWQAYYQMDEVPNLAGKHDYEVELTPGTHEMYVYILASQATFDAIRITTLSTSGVDNVISKSEEAATLNAYGVTGAIVSNVPAKVYSLSGVYYGNVNGRLDVPAGLYIVKAGSKAKKVLVK